MSEKGNRDVLIVRTSVIGIIANVLLAAIKVIIGLASNSIAIVMDAVNNMSDAASSVITIVGTKLAGKDADRKHPFGYGRIEYLSAMIISLIVLYAGATAFEESVKKIIHPDVPEYGTFTLIIVAVGVVVKIFLGRYVKSIGIKVNSDSLVNSAEEATLDSVISASTLAAAFIYLFFNISLEAWLGAIIALVIIKSGIEMLKDTLSKILGEQVDMDFARRIKKTISSYPEVSGAYDLVMHNYGPDSYNGSVHIEVPDTMTTVELDRLTRKIQDDVYREHNVLLTAVGVYSKNTKDDEAAALKADVGRIVTAHPHVRSMHGFYADLDKKAMRFDVVISFDAKDRRAVFAEVMDKLKAEYPEYQIQSAIDLDYSEGA